MSFAALKINEVVGSTTSTDVEFIELVGPAGQSLAGFSLIIVEGDSGSPIGQIDRRLDFSASDTIGGNGFFLIGNASVTGTYGVTPDVIIADNYIENSSYTIALVETATIGASGTMVSGVETVIDTVGVSDGGVGDSFFFGAPVLGPDGSFLPAGVRRLVDGQDTDTAADWGFSSFFNDPSINTPTAGSGSVGPAPTDRTIMEIQGTGLSSTFEGDTVRTTGVVTALATNSSGIVTGAYIQDSTGDGNAATSDAIFLNGAGISGFAVGDAVTVIGTVVEIEAQGGPDNLDLDITGMTLTSVEAQTAGSALPSATILDTSALGASGARLADARDYFETVEGMLVTAEDLLAVSGTNRFGEIFAVEDQGASASGISSRGTLNISETDYNPEKIQIEGLGFSTPVVDTGALLGEVTGVISYEFGNYEILATEDFSSQITQSSLTTDSTTLSGSATEMTIASYNVLNLDPNDADGDADVANGRFAAIAGQIVNNLNTPDVIALQEVQDNSGSDNDGVIAADQTLQALVDAIALAGGPTYSFIDNTFIGDNTSGGQPGGNIRTAFLYNADNVALVSGSVQTIGNQTTPGQSFDGARLPLVADFEFNGEVVTLVNNHFSSKGGSAPIVSQLDDFETRQDEPGVNGSVDERNRQATEVEGFVSSKLASDPAANVVVLGDFNEFEFNPPLDILESAGLTNLTDTVPEDERYSFNFQGNSQSLDHILVSDSLKEGAQFDIVHTNTEFAETSGRASDHDPLVASLNLLGTETFSVDLFDKPGLGSRIVITDTDGSTDTRFVGPLQFRGTKLDSVGLEVTAKGGRLTAINGDFGVANFCERPQDWDEINRNQSITLSLDDAKGAATELTFNKMSGTIGLSFFDGTDEIDVGADEFVLADGTVAVDSPDLFDRIVVEYAGSGLSLTGIEIEQIAPLPVAPPPLLASGPLFVDGFDFI